MSQPTASHGSTLTFRLACWVLGLIAFIQIVTAGVALAVRVENAREIRIEERIVTKIVTVSPKTEKKEAGPVVALPPPPPIPAEVPLPPARPLDAPAIADAKVEALVNEAREARVAEDMGRAIIKLEEALDLDPREPNTLYELGLVYETMAAYDTALAEKAAEAYQRVFELGTTKAGALYPLAARKLRDGIARPVDMRGKLALGRVRIFKDDAYQDGERLVLTVPVSAAPGSEPSADDFFVKVEFFDKARNNEPQPAGPECVTTYEWVSGAIDWLGGEEILRVTYMLPPQEAGQEHLFGKRAYYGQIVELVYKNELIDSQAWPRHLASRSKVQPQQGLDPLFLESDFDPNLGVLPPLDNELTLPPIHSER
ncbi:hypothetical protein [Haloferula sp.]|uniref:hypothetical protein n=1 Tax=Haloferula sp. TaxID=2497595 RepID=UPI00329E606F